MDAEKTQFVLVIKISLADLPEGLEEWEKTDYQE